MDILTTLILGGLVTFLTQLMKRVAPNTSPLYWVACLAIVGGGFYGFLFPLIPTAIIEKMAFSFTTAIAIYEVLKNFTK